MAVCPSTEAARCDGLAENQHPHKLDEAQTEFCPLAPLGCLQKLMSAAELQEHLQLTNELHLQMFVNRLQLLEAVFQVLHEFKKHKLLPFATTSPLLPPAIKPFSWPSDSPPHSTPPSVHTECIRCDLGMGRYDNMDAHEDTEEIQKQLHAKDEEITSLRTQVIKLEKQIRSKNTVLEDRDFRLSLIENSNHDGSMIWKIPQFSQRKADAENGKYTSIFSLPFCTGRYGFKMCLRLYIMGDGIGKGTHLSLFFVVMRGEFDNILQWPFAHKVTFKLINQAGGRDIVESFRPDPMSSSFRKPKSDMNIASGCPRFVSHTELDRGGFVVDDTIFIKCMIDTSTICHP